jgi:putative hemolysin
VEQLTTPQNLASRSRNFSYARPEDPLLQRLVIRTVEKLTGSRHLQRIYQELHEETPNAFDVWSNALRKLNVTVAFQEEQLARIPSQGPVIFVANHPFGVLDGIIFLDLVTRVRKDYFLLINEVLAHEPLVAGHFLPVDFRPSKAAALTNLETRRLTTERLRQGEALVIFPGGGVATVQKINGEVEEFPWRSFIASRIHETQCTVVPIYFHGKNSPLFHLVSKVSMNMRLGLLLHELMNKRGTCISVAIGDPIPYDQMKVYKNRQALIDFLYKKTMDLKL